METINQGKFLKRTHLINKYLIRVMVAALTVSLILGSVQLLYDLGEVIINPPFLRIQPAALLDIFSLVLIIAVGYELIKSMLIIITSDVIPSVPVIQIAVIAIANKIITLDLKHTEFQTMIGLGVLMTGLGLTYFLMTLAKKSVDVEPGTKEES